MEHVTAVNKNGHLSIGGMDTVALAAKYGTPLYVMDRILSDEGLGADVVSGGELYTALQAGFPAEKLYFHGNNKTAAELTMALESGVGHIVLDNLAELELLSSIAGANGKTANVLFRIKPGIDAHTHNFIMTGQIDSKFGFALETGEAMEAVKKALTTPAIHVSGIHCHIGSQIFDIEPFCRAAEIMLQFACDVRDECGYSMEQLNLGGGFGIRYVPQDDPKALE
ncbi:MAG: diaminopimelate decarboxylase, partial [Ruthenibacterium sp.]